MKKVILYSILLLSALLLITSVSDGQNWETLNTGTTSRIYDMSIPPGQNDIVYAATGSGLYTGLGTTIKTTDGGDTWTEIYPTSGTSEILKSIFFTSNDTGYAGGNNDTFLKTTDGGVTWTSITISSSGDYFHTIKFIDATHGIAVTNPVGTASSTVFVTADAGANWTVATGPNHGVYDLAYSNANTVIAVGAQNQSISRSTDGGLTWTLVNNGLPTLFLLGVDFSGDYGVAVGSHGDAFISNNSGLTWTMKLNQQSENFEGIHVFNSDSTIFGGGNEEMYKTTDGGLNWQIEYDGSGTSHFYDIEFSDNGTGFAGLSDGRILRKPAPVAGGPELSVSPNPYTFPDTYIGETSNSDFTFSNIGTDVLNITNITFTNPAFSIDYTAFPIQPGQSGDLPVHFTPDAQGLFEGTMQVWSDDPVNNPYEVDLSGNGIVELINGWEWINTGYDFILFDIDFPEGQNQIGYCVGESLTYNGDGIVIKTTDGGSTWTQLTPDGIPGLTGMSFVDMNTGYAIGWDDYLIKTTDGGLSWDTLTYATGTFSFEYDVEFFDNLHGVVLAGQEVFVTEDGGTTWNPSANSLASCNMVEYLDASTLVTVGYEDYIYKSTDGGYNWTLKYSGINSEVLLGVDFLNDQYGIAAGDYGHILTTTDGGENWTLNTQVGDQLLHAPFIWDEDTAWVCGTPEMVFKTTDGGLNWNSAYNGNYEKAFYRIMFTDNYTGFICGSHGVVLRKEGINGPMLSVTPEEINFEDTFVGQTSSVDVTFTNSGNEILNITDITFTNPAFSIDYTAFPIQPGQSGDLPVHFSPTIQGLIEGTMIIQSNDPINPTYEVLLSGNGVVELIDGWQWINTGFDFILMDVQFPEGQNQIGYAVGESLTYNGDGIVIKTTDSGGTWEQLTTNGIPGLTGMSFVDLQTGYAIGWDDYLIKTTDGGATWDTVNYATGTYSFYYDVEFWDQDNGVALAGLDIYVTDDGGLTWTQGSGITHSCTMVEYLNTTTLIAVGNEDRIFKSVDGGLTWVQKYGGSGSVLLGVDFMNDQYGIASGDYGHILTTTDGGESWTLDTQVGDVLLHTPFIWNEDTAWIVGTPEYVYKSLNAGTTWNSAYNGNYQKAFYRIIFTDNYTGFISGSGGVILRKEGLPEIPAIAIDPVSIDFEDTYVGETSTGSFTITNAGLAPLVVSDIISSNAVFSVEFTGLTIAPQASEEVEINFTPDSEGLHEGTLQVESNDPNLPTTNISVSGMGLLATPSIAVSASEIIFDTTLVNESTTDTLIISNTGMATLYVTGITSDNSVFTVDITNFNLEPGENQEVAVSFTPDQQMFFEGTLTIESNDPAGNMEVELSGFGDIGIGFKENLGSKDIKIYPNPASDIIYIENADWQQAVIYDLLGNIKIDQIINKENNSVDVSSLSEGLYLIRFKTKERLNTQKITVKR